jgi:hypothetical protein
MLPTTKVRVVSAGPAGIVDDRSAGTGVHPDHEALDTGMILCIRACVLTIRHHGNEPDRLTERRSPGVRV